MKRRLWCTQEQREPGVRVREGRPALWLGPQGPGGRRALPGSGCPSHGAGQRGALPVAWPAPGAAAAEAVPGDAAPPPAAVVCTPVAESKRSQRVPEEASRPPARGAHSCLPPPSGVTHFTTKGWKSPLPRISPLPGTSNWPPRPGESNK